jgi:hypothetical protein
LRAGLSAKSGSFRTYLSTIRRNGWATEDHFGFRLTNEGAKEVVDFERLPEGAALVEYWVNELGGGAGRILSTIAGAFPDALSPDEIEGLTGYSHVSGSFRTYVSKLKTLSLIEKTPAGLRLNEELAQ